MKGIFSKYSLIKKCSYKQNEKIQKGRKVVGQKDRTIANNLKLKIAYFFRSKNTVNIITKNMLDCLVAGVAYWAMGWAVAYGPEGNPFSGGLHFSWTVRIALLDQVR